MQVRGGLTTRVITAGVGCCDWGSMGGAGWGVGVGWGGGRCGAVQLLLLLHGMVQHGVGIKS
jgi:hypothetical protein